MEYSKNFNFTLPSRDNDVDLADINELANNFRKIDENAVTSKDFEATKDELEKTRKTLITDVEGVNKLNPEHWTSGSMDNNGVIRSSSSLCYTSEPIKVTSGDVVRAYSLTSANTYNVANIRFVTAYENGVINADKGLNANSTSYTVPDGVTEIIVSGGNGIQLIILNAEAPREKVEYVAPIIKPNEEFFKDFYNIDLLMQDSEIVDVASRNAIDKSKLTVGELSSTNIGEVDVTVTNKVTTDYIPVKNGQSVRLLYRGITSGTPTIYPYMFYNEYKEPIMDSYVNGNAVVNVKGYPDVAYMRFSFTASLQNYAILLVGDIIDDDITDYVEYGTRKEVQPKGYRKPIIVANGDSITFGYAPHGDASVNEYYADMYMGVSYIDMVAHKLNCELLKYAVTGSTCGYRNETGNETMHNPLCDRIDEMQDEADIVYIAIGSNDWGYNDKILLGTFEGRKTEGKGTFYGALDSVCSQLIAKYPNSAIVFATPIKRCEPSLENNAYDTNNAGETLTQYCNAIKEVCEYYSIPVVDMYAESMINPRVDKAISIPDGIHPNEVGHERMARRVAGLIPTFAGCTITNGQYASSIDIANYVETIMGGIENGSY